MQHYKDNITKSLQPKSPLFSAENAQNIDQQKN